MKTFKSAALLILTGIALAACRNPFDPSADIRLVRFYDYGGNFVMSLLQDQADTAIEEDWKHRVRAQIYNYSSVAAKFHSYTVVYKQVGPQANAGLGPGLPIPSLGGAAGRRYTAGFYIRGLLNNEADFVDEQFSVLILTDEFFMYVKNNTDTVDGGIDCELTFYGVDENDHDVTVGGTFHVEIF